MVGKIKKALDFMRNQHFEVPFIAFYRKEYVQPELNISDLWRVYKFDAKVSVINSNNSLQINALNKFKLNRKMLLKTDNRISVHFIVLYKL